jgi:hypothetical protein
MQKKIVLSLSERRGRRSADRQDIRNLWGGRRSRDSGSRGTNRSDYSSTHSFHSFNLPFCFFAMNLVFWSLLLLCNGSVFALKIPLRQQTHSHSLSLSRRTGNGAVSFYNSRVLAASDSNDVTLEYVTGRVRILLVLTMV